MASLPLRESNSTLALKGTAAQLSRPCKTTSSSSKTSRRFVGYKTHAQIEATGGASKHFHYSPKTPLESFTKQSSEQLAPKLHKIK